MTSINHLDLYLVREGRVRRATERTRWDGISSVAVLAKDRKAALEVARAYDAGRVQPDNVMWRGSRVVAARLPDHDG